METEHGRVGPAARRAHRVGLRRPRYKLIMEHGRGIQDRALGAQRYGADR
jgi:hypothetical protein